MKKLITVFLILALLLPACSVADDPDPIVGCWYIYSGIVDDADVYFEFHTFVFTSDGNIFSSKYDVSKDGITSLTDFKVIGMWSNENNDYYINIGFKGAEKLILDNDTIFFPVTDSYK